MLMFVFCCAKKSYITGRFKAKYCYFCSIITCQMEKQQLSGKSLTELQHIMEELG